MYIKLYLIAKLAQVVSTVNLFSWFNSNILNENSSFNAEFINYSETSPYN